MPKARQNRTQRGLTILNRICLHVLQNGGIYSDETRQILVDAMIQLVTGKKEHPHCAIDHIDGDPYNNEPSNLRIVTVRKNL